MKFAGNRKGLSLILGGWCIAALLALASPSSVLASAKNGGKSAKGKSELVLLMQKGLIQSLPPGPPLMEFVWDLNGKAINLSAYRGKTVFLTFWTTWCPNCKVEMPELERLYKANKSKGFVILAVNLKESAQKAKEYAKRLGLTYPVMLDPNGQLAARLSVWSVPTTLIIDKKGVPRGLVRGTRKWISPVGKRFMELLLAD